ncbi:nitrogen fixation protein FixH [Babesia caballi]|uniref:Nitrogen fixation protein FixH n=1 Tax=Babesia caballi TaxID=5871 RepID=A0AAV4LT16_BABCB|nr:nitrogen fixation protein FixH [Babesia caballi]
MANWVPHVDGWAREVLFGVGWRFNGSCSCTKKGGSGECNCYCNGCSSSGDNHSSHCTCDNESNGSGKGACRPNSLFILAAAIIGFFVFILALKLYFPYDEFNGYMSSKLSRTKMP